MNTKINILILINSLLNKKLEKNAKYQIIVWKILILYIVLIIIKRIYIV